MGLSGRRRFAPPVVAVCIASARYRPSGGHILHHLPSVQRWRFLVCTHRRLRPHGGVRRKKDQAEAAARARDEALRRQQYDEAMAWCKDAGKTHYAAAIRTLEDDETLAWPLISRQGLLTLGDPLRSRAIDRGSPQQSPHRAGKAASEAPQREPPSIS